MKTFIPVILCLLAGCVDDLVSTDASRNKPLRVRSTDKIDEFKGDGQVVKPDVRITNPITGPLQAYEPLKQRMTAWQVGEDLDAVLCDPHANFDQRVHQSFGCDDGPDVLPAHRFVEDDVQVAVDGWKTR